MRVSVITIFKDEERFLSEAIESVLHQTYRDWEYFLVDDGSTDGSSEIAREVADQYPNVHYLEHSKHRNLGRSASRNLALDAATGEYMALLDADDIWEPEKLEQQITLVDRDSSLAMIYGAPLYWYSWTGNDKDLKRDHLQKLNVAQSETFEPLMLVGRFLREPAATPCTCDVLIRRSLVQEVGGWVNEFRGLYDDQVLCVKIASFGRVHIGPSRLSRYRIHPNSCCAREFRLGRHGAARRRFLKWADRYLSDVGLKDPALSQIVAEELSVVRREIFHAWRVRITRFASVRARPFLDIL